MNYHNIKFESSYGLFSQIPKSDSIEIAFAGRSNVGKSSLINKIFNKKDLARVSSMPGKTITINFFDLDGVKFVDLPGYGYAKVSKSEKQRWSGLIEGYFTSDRNIELVVMLVDIRHAPSKDDLLMIDFLIETETPFIIALTKSDKLSNNQKEKRLNELKSEIPAFDDIKTIPVSSKSGEGIEELKGIFKDIANNI